LTVLEVNGLKKYFGKTKAVDGLSFSLSEGEVVGFLAQMAQARQPHSNA